MDTERLWTIDDLAAYLNITKAMAYHLTNKGRIPCWKIGKRLRFDPEAVRSFVRNQCLLEVNSRKARLKHIASAKELLHG